MDLSGTFEQEYNTPIVIIRVSGLGARSWPSAALFSIAAVAMVLAGTVNMLRCLPPADKFAGCCASTCFLPSDQVALNETRRDFVSTNAIWPTHVAESTSPQVAAESCATEDSDACHAENGDARISTSHHSTTWPVLPEAPILAEPTTTAAAAAAAAVAAAAARSSRALFVAQRSPSPIVWYTYSLHLFLLRQCYTSVARNDSMDF